MAERAEPSASVGLTISAGGGLREMRSMAARTLEMLESAPSKSAAHVEFLDDQLTQLVFERRYVGLGALHPLRRRNQGDVLLGAVALHVLNFLAEGVCPLLGNGDGGFDLVQRLLLIRSNHG